MKTAIAVLLVAPLLAGCGLFAAKVYSHFSGEDFRYLKADPTSPLAAAHPVSDDVLAVAANVEARPAALLAVLERRPGAAAALAGELNARGLVYGVVAESAPYAIEGVDGGETQGRAVILALPADPAAGPAVSAGSAQAGVFDYAARAADGTRRARAWTSIDIDVDGQRLRVVAADLASADPEARAAWTLELRSGPGRTDREVIEALGQP
jgi:hypothetical protein